MKFDIFIEEIKGVSLKSQERRNEKLPEMQVAFFLSILTENTDFEITHGKDYNNLYIEIGIGERRKTYETNKNTTIHNSNSSKK
jgi:hypothetical protein